MMLKKKIQFVLMIILITIIGCQKDHYYVIVVHENNAHRWETTETHFNYLNKKYHDHIYYFSDRENRSIKIKILNDSIFEVSSKALKNKQPKLKEKYKYKGNKERMIVTSIISTNRETTYNISYVLPFSRSSIKIERNEQLYPFLLGDTIYFDSNATTLKFREFEFRRKGYWKDVPYIRPPFKKQSK